MTTDETVGLRRSYARLLLAYPRAYRRDNGPELMTTLLDAAAPGQRKPWPSDARNLIAGGLRQRFRLPAGRLPLVIATISALTFGGVGAAAGSLLARQASGPLPSSAAVAELATRVSGEPYLPEIGRVDGYTIARPSVYTGVPAEVVGWSEQDARTRLTAAGWRLDPTVTTPTTLGRSVPLRTGNEVAQQVDIAGTLTRIDGTRDGILLTAIVTTFDGQSSVMVHTARTMSLTTPYLLVLGLLGGLLGGWLLIARVGYALRSRSGPGRRVAVMAATTAATTLALPTTQTYRSVIDTLSTTTVSPPLDVSTEAWPHIYYLQNFTDGSYAIVGFLVIVAVAASAFVLKSAEMRSGQKKPKPVIP